MNAHQRRKRERLLRREYPAGTRLRGLGGLWEVLDWDGATGKVKCDMLGIEEHFPYSEWRDPRTMRRESDIASLERSILKAQRFALHYGVSAKRMGTLNLYSGTPPPTGGTVTGRLLASLPLPSSNWPKPGP